MSDAEVGGDILGVVGDNAALCVVEELPCDTSSHHRGAVAICALRNPPSSSASCDLIASTRGSTDVVWAAGLLLAGAVGAEGTGGHPQGVVLRVGSETHMTGYTARLADLAAVHPGSAPGVTAGGAAVAPMMKMIAVAHVHGGNPLDGCASCSTSPMRAHAEGSLKDPGESGGEGSALRLVRAVVAAVAAVGACYTPHHDEKVAEVHHERRAGGVPCSPLACFQTQTEIGPFPRCLDKTQRIGFVTQ